MSGAWLAAGLRRWRDDAPACLAIAVLVLISALVLGLVPRLLERVDEQALRTAVTSEPQAGRGIQLLSSAQIAGGPPDPMAGIDAAGAAAEDELPASVRALVRDRTLVVDTPRFLVSATGVPPALATLRIQPGALDRVRFTSGRAPTAATSVLPMQGGLGAAPAYEVAFSAATARTLGVRVGDKLGLTPYPRDLLATRFLRGGLNGVAAVSVVGIFDVVDPGDTFWFGDASLDLPATVSVTNEKIFVDAIALLSPDAYPELVSAVAETALFEIDWRLDVDPARIGVADVDRLLADLRRVATLFPPAATGTSVAIEARTNLTKVVAGHVARWLSAELVLGVAGVGTAAVGIAALALVALLGAQRRRQTVRAWLARGASRLQLMGDAVAEAILIAGPPAGLAIVGALLAVPAGSSLPTLALGAGVGVVAAALLVAADLPLALRSTGGAGAAPSTRPAVRRGPIEATVVILAVAGVVLLRQRTAPAVTVGSATGPDPFIAAVPALAGLAAGIIAARAIRGPMGLLGWIAARSRGLVPVLALRRATRGGTAAAMLLVLMATTTIATFSAATLAHLDQAATAIAWHDVGADIRVSTPIGALPSGVHLSTVPGVTAATSVYDAIVPLGVGGAVVELLAVDPAGLERVTAGTPADPALPGELSSSPTAPLPAIVSASLSGPAYGVGLGDTFDLSVTGGRVRFRAIEARDAFPTIALDAPAFVVVSRPQLEAAVGGQPFADSSVLLRAPGVSADALGRLIVSRVPAAIVQGRVETETSIRHSPITDAAATGVVLAALVAAGYAATALIAALALASAARATEVAHLRTFGLTTRQSIGLVLLENLPTVAIAFALGVLCGLVLFVLVEPGLGLADLLGSPLTVPLAVEPVELVALLSVAAAVTVASVGLGAVLERRAVLSTSVRRGIA